MPLVAAASEDSLQPQNQSAIGEPGQCFLDHRPNLFGVIAGTEVAHDDPLIVKASLPLDEVVQVHVPVLMDLFFAMAGSDERHHPQRQARSRGRG